MTAGAVTQLTFLLRCAQPPLTGTVEIQTVTTGEGLDPDGYLIAMDPALNQTVGINETVTLQDVPAGDRALRLGGVAGNCVVQGDESRIVTVVAGETSRTTFEVTCWPPLTGRIAFVKEPLDTGDESDIYVRNADGSSSLNVTDSRFELEREVNWSPDGTRLAFTRLSPQGSVFEQIFIVDAGGSVPPRPLPNAVDGSQPKWSNDGERILFLNISTLTTVRVVGSGLRRLTHDSLSVRSASWSPDDSRIAFDESSSALYIISSSGGVPLNITAGSDLQTVREVAWSPVGDRIAFVGSRLGENFDTRIYTIRPDGQDLTSLTDSAARYANPTWAPDGTKLAFTLRGVPTDPEGSEETDVIYLMHADGSGVRAFTALNERADFPSWAP